MKLLKGPDLGTVCGFAGEFDPSVTAREAALRDARAGISSATSAESAHSRLSNPHQDLSPPRKNTHALCTLSQIAKVEPAVHWRN